MAASLVLHRGLGMGGGRQVLREGISRWLEEERRRKDGRTSGGQVVVADPSSFLASPKCLVACVSRVLGSREEGCQRAWERRGQQH